MPIVLRYLRLTLAMFPVELFLTCCVVFTVWLWMKPRKSSPPMLPGALPLIGHAHKLIGDAIHMWNFEKYICNTSLQKGGVIEVRGGLHSFYIITDPDDGLVVANVCLDKPFLYDFAKEMYNNGLITSNGSTWKLHRKLINPAFNQQVLNTFVDEYNVQARILVSQLTSEVGNDSFDIRRYLINFSLRTASRTTLGLNKDDQNIIDHEYAHATEELLATIFERGKKLWLQFPFIYNRSSLKRKQDTLIKIIKDIMKAVINKRKSELKAENNPNNDQSPTDKFKPLLNQLIELADKHHVFTEDDMREHLDTIVLGTFDTTASVITFILILLGSYQDVQERVYKELQEVLGNDDKDVSKHDLTRLVYLEAVIKETLRLYPVVPVVARKVDTDVKLKDYTLPAGSTAIIALYGINRNPIWGEDAAEFRPERWLDPGTLPDPNAFASFSLGRRNCIGKLYGMMLVKTGLAHILRRYHITGNINNVVIQTDIVLKPASGHNITLKLRA